MKGFRLTILVLSILLLTISSGLLFYKNLFFLDSSDPGGKVDFEELRRTDLKVNATATMMRLNLSSDSTLLENQITRLKELLNILTDINKNTAELSSSITKIRSYFEKKIVDLNQFQTGIKELKIAINALNPSYNELTKNKIKFSVDNRDFYRESIIDALFYVSQSTKDNETRLTEDKKILGQVLNYANAPNPHIQKFSAYIDIVLKRTKEIDLLIDNINTDISINNELKTVSKFYKEAQDARAKDGEIFLTMIFVAIVIYLISVVVILRKFT